MHTAAVALSVSMVAWIISDPVQKGRNLTNIARYLLAVETLTSELRVHHV